MTLHFTQYSPVRARDSLEQALAIFEEEGMLWERADALADLVRAVSIVDPDQVDDLATPASRQEPSSRSACWTFGAMPSSRRSPGSRRRR